MTAVAPSEQEFVQKLVAIEQQLHNSDWFGWHEAYRACASLVEEYSLDWRAWHVLARASLFVRAWEAAERAAVRALALRTEFATDTGIAEMWLCLSVAREMQGYGNDALAAAQQANRAAPQLPSPLLKVADMLRDVDRFDEADAAYTALTKMGGADWVGPGPADVYFCRSFLRFKQRRWQEGWEDYGQRWKAHTFNTTANISAKPASNRAWWTGKPLNDKTLVVWSEQGTGDTLWGMRYLDALEQRYPDANIILRMPEDLLSYVRHNYPQYTTCALADPIPEHNVHAPMLDLPRLLGCHEPVLPKRHTAPAPLAWDRSKRRVGIVWQGSPGFIYNGLRSTLLGWWQPILRVPDIEFVSLQKDQLPPLNAVDVQKHMTDWAGTANVVAGLDLVIGVDTGIMHLCGLLGVPTWWLVTSTPKVDWRLYHDDVLWYPDMRIWRNNLNWLGTLEQVADELRG